MEQLINIFTGFELMFKDKRFGGEYLLVAWYFSNERPKLPKIDVIAKVHFWICYFLWGVSIVDTTQETRNLIIFGRLMTSGNNLDVTMEQYYTNL